MAGRISPARLNILCKHCVGPSAIVGFVEGILGRSASSRFSPIALQPDLSGPP